MIIGFAKRVVINNLSFCTLIMSKILVTGSEGLIGYRLCKKLNRKHDVVRFDLKLGKNILNKKQLSKSLSRCDGVIHLAGQSRVPAGYKNPLKTIKSNILGTTNILQCIKEINPKIWCIYASSREVYGEQKKRLSEKDRLDPINVYAVSKLSSEMLMKIFERNYEINTFVVRFSNVYGGLNDHHDRVIPKFIKQAVREENITVEGGEQTFDFVHVDDATDGVVRLLDKINQGKAKQKTYLFVTGKGTSILNLAKLIIRITNSNSKIVKRKPRNYDVNYFVGDPSTTKKNLGWEAKISLEDGLRKYWNDFNKSTNYC